MTPPLAHPLRQGRVLSANSTTPRLNDAPLGVRMRKLIIPLCIAVSAGVCLSWSQAPGGSPTTAQSTGKPVPQIKLRHVPVQWHPANAGQKMYSAYCAACHGEDGKGVGRASLALSRNAPDLTLLSYRNGGRYPEQRVMTLLSRSSEAHWSGSGRMPDWYSAFVSLNRSCPMLADLRASNISEYVRTMQTAKRNR